MSKQKIVKHERRCKQFEKGRKPQIKVEKKNVKHSLKI